MFSVACVAGAERGGGDNHTQVRSARGRMIFFLHLSFPRSLLPLVPTPSVRPHLIVPAMQALPSETVQ